MSLTSRLVAVCTSAALGLVTVAPAASAADPKRDNLTVSPFTGAKLSLGDATNRLSLGFSYLPRGGGAQGLRFDLQASTPLDEATRKAAFNGDVESLLAGFGVEVFLGYDSRMAALGLAPWERDIASVRATCDALGLAGDCTSDTVRKATCEALDLEGDACTSAAVNRRLGTALTRGFLPSMPMRLPDTPDIFWSLGVDLSLTLDRTTAYRTADHDAEQGFETFDAEVGLHGTVAVSRHVQLDLRVGWEALREVQTSEVERCTAVGEGEGARQDCAPVSVLDAPPETSHALYSRFAVTAVFDAVWQGLVPGVEARVGAEGLLGDLPTAELRLALFVAPLTKPLQVEFGVGVDAAFWLADAPSDDPSRSHTAGDFKGVVPFGFVGGAFGAISPTD